MKNLNKSIGSYGETIGCDFLIKEGYRILHRNFYCKIGEIDIIGLDKDILCFIEVKTRFSTKYGYPMEAINKHKALKLKKLAEFYIIKKGLTKHFIRFDALEIFLNTNDDSYRFNLIKNVLSF